jgi:hypothetical protein
MAELSDAQRKRAESRKKRRKDSDDTGTDAGEAAAVDGQESHDAVKQAAKVAAGVAAAGVAAAAAKALASHDDGDEQEPPQEQSDPEPDEQPEPEAQAPEEPEQEPEREPEPEEHREPVTGAGPSDARRVLDRARDQLEDLLGRPVESVSSLERTHDGWLLALEVVDLRRIPESTDVLASYEMELDDDLNLRRYEQVRRYVRGRAEEQQ